MSEPLSMIPESKRNAAEKALRETFGISAPDSIELLAGGLSSALVYKITIGSKAYVLRIMMQTDRLRDPGRQFACMRLAARAACAPRVYHTNEENALSITDFILTQPLREYAATPEKLLVDMARTIKSIHAIPLFPRLVNFLDGVDMFITQFNTTQLLRADATAEHFSFYSKIQQSYPRNDTDLVSSHNDLNPNNILFDGNRLWIIDWEAAFANDRYVDLAIAAKSFAADEAQEGILLDTYFDHSVTEYARARFFLMQQVCHMYYAMIMLMFAAAQKPRGTVADDTMETPRMLEAHRQIACGEVTLAEYDGKLLYGKTLLNEALINMKTERFASSLALVTA
jgi:thiamine kinase-like enzyme